MAADPTTMALDDLPPEMFDNIFDFLIDDKASLHACTLVSKCWYELSRRHKFAIVKVTGRNNRFEGFFSFCYTQPDVVTHIRELIFVGGGERMVDWGVRPFVFQYEDFIYILPSLKSLRKLTFRGVQILGDVGLQDAFVATRAPLACLDVLEFRLGDVHAGPHFLMVLSSLLSVMSVGTLKISGQMHRRGFDVGARSLVSPCRLALLEVDFLGEHVGFFERILAPGTRPPVQSHWR
ncbi:hypothetical protein K466DRAFT_199693 [Polyporus arcularius HHB13444]|uniref:F-box domain-containing protein n=1 Tax=Polyporus arcularius HHB13444 TaxID=1314778 RepID=A0A5C3P9B6_9APHY|nr:hypothetical protein K466DRAFT_199693 [Polyporus arcularius HHB13444]